MSIDEITYVSHLYGEAFARQDRDQIVDLYVYRDSKMLLPTTRTAHTYKFDPGVVNTREAKFITWKPGRNPLFVHASHTGAAIGVLTDLGFQAVEEDHNGDDARCSITEKRNG